MVAQSLPSLSSATFSSIPSSVMDHYRVKIEEARERRHELLYREDHGEELGEQWTGRTERRLYSYAAPTPPSHGLRYASRFPSAIELDQEDNRRTQYHQELDYERQRRHQDQAYPQQRSVFKDEYREEERSRRGGDARHYLVEENHRGGQRREEENHRGRMPSLHSFLQPSRPIIREDYNHWRLDEPRFHQRTRHVTSEPDLQRHARHYVPKVEQERHESPVYAHPRVLPGIDHFSSLTTRSASVMPSRASENIRLTSTQMPTSLMHHTSGVRMHPTVAQLRSSEYDEDSRSSTQSPQRRGRVNAAMWLSPTSNVSSPASSSRHAVKETASADETVREPSVDETPSRKRRKRKTRLCTISGCDKLVVDHGVCIRHGGGKRCNVDGCDCRAQNKGLCWKHGGYTICQVDGCDKRAKSRGMCWSHGGGTQCKTEGCEKIAVSRGRCWAHGGGKRCKLPECQKPAAQRMDNFCSEHYAAHRGILS